MSKYPIIPVDFPWNEKVDDNYQRNIRERNFKV